MITRLNVEKFEAVKKLLNVDEKIRFNIRRGKTFSVKRVGDVAEVVYTRPVQAFRAIAEVKAHIGDFSVCGNPYMEEIGYMVDVARDAVPKIETLKKTALNLALFGYTRLYLYLEDMFSVDGEPFCGYLRGRYTREQLRELDEYCYGLGIEVVPCVQTLAHLGTMMRWQEYKSVCDYKDVLLVGDDRTYEFIDDLLKEISICFKSNTVHIGFDEAYMLGLGEYLTKNGYRDRFDIMSEHLMKVDGIAKKYGLSVMLWSDMFFTSGERQYCNEKDESSAKKLGKLPEDATLVYWNYYKNDYASYADALKIHKQSGMETAFAGGAWKWSGFTPWNETSITRTETAFRACRDNGVKDTFLTAWGDDGSEASIFSTLPVQAVFAELCYTGERTGVEDVFKTVTQTEFDDFIALDMQVFGDDLKNEFIVTTLYKTVLYSDPLSGTMDMFFEHFDFTEAFVKAAARVAEVVDKNGEYAYLFRTAKALAELAALKWNIGLKLKLRYDDGDKAGLLKIAEEDIPEIYRLTEIFYEAWREQWEKENSTCGFEVHDARIGGVILRLKNVARLIKKYCNGETDKIYDLEGERLHLTLDEALKYGTIGTYKDIHTVNVS